MMDIIYDYASAISMYLGVVCFIGLFHIDSINKLAFFPGSLNYMRVLEGTLFEPKKDSDHEQDAYTIEKWVCENKNDDGISQHWWAFSDIPEKVHTCFYNCANSAIIKKMFAPLFNPSEYEMYNVKTMDEIYLTGNNRQENIHSDQVFYTSHIDGPFSFFPFCSVYRVLIAVNDNTNIKTCFPMIFTQKTIKKGQICAFDFNREIHYIENIETYDSTTTPRVLLKCHYVFFPKGWFVMGNILSWCNGIYNCLFRQLFLKSIQPNNMIEHLGSIVVMYGTYGFVYSDLCIGHKNIVYISALLYSHHYYLSKPVICGIVFFTWFYKHLMFVFSENQLCVEFTTFIRDNLLYCMVFLYSLTILE